MSDCVIISGKLEAKLRNKLFAYFHQRYVELVYVEKQINNTTSSGHYEMRLYKNKNKTQSSLYSFIINPISMTCYINYLNSNKHQFTFVCSSQQTSICFSAHTKYERDAWISVLEQLQWQYQPNCNQIIIKQTKENSYNSHSNLSTITTSTSTISNESSDIKEPEDLTEEDSDDDIYMNYNQYQTKNQKSISYIISLTQKNTNNDNNYQYNYFNSNLWKQNNTSSNTLHSLSSSSSNHQQCACNECQGQKFTILGLLSNKYQKHDEQTINIANNNDNNDNNLKYLQCIKSPQYQSIQSIPNNIPSIQT